MLRVQIKKVVDVSDWDDLVIKTYGKPYCFQQQDGCKSRGTFNLSVPSEGDGDYENDTIPEVVNGGEMGVSFKAWLERDPKQPLKGEKGERVDGFGIGLFWERNFYPDINMLANDLHSKGLIEEGDYLIDIDW